MAKHPIPDALGEYAMNNLPKAWLAPWCAGFDIGLNFALQHPTAARLISESFLAVSSASSTVVAELAPVLLAATKEPRDA